MCQHGANRQSVVLDIIAEVRMNGVTLLDVAMLQASQQVGSALNDLMQVMIR